MLHRACRVCLAAAFSLVLNSSASATPQSARPADAFVDAIGVNTHFGNAQYPENAYANRLIAAKLASLGVRNIRDHTWNDAGLQRVDELYRKFGIRATLVLGETTRSPRQLVQLLKAHPAYEAVEGLNEPDFTKRSYKALTDDPGKNDYAATRAFQDGLYFAVKADPETKQLPVLSPAMGRSQRSQFLLPIEFDVAAVHRYAWEGKSARQPGFELDEVIANLAELRGRRPLWVTETGYYNEPLAHARAASEEVCGIYMPRQVAEFFNRGVMRIYFYELADQGTDKSAREQNFGLLRHDMTEKPAFIAMKNLIDLLKEPGAKPFQPESLDMSLSPADERIHHTLLQKSDRRFYLLVWQEVLSYDPLAKKAIDNPAVNVTLTLSQPLDVRMYLPSQSAQAVAEHRRQASIELRVPDQMLIVELSTPAND